MPKCFVSKNEFLAAVGVVNADIAHGKTSVRYSTKYALVAERVRSLGRSIGGRVLHTITDEGLHVVSVKGLRP